MSNTTPTNQPKNISLSDLRKECRAKGIRLKKQSFSWGPHLSFIIDGHNCTSGNVCPVGFYDKNKTAVDALEAIKKKYYGFTIDGEKMVGLKPDNFITVL